MVFNSFDAAQDKWSDLKRQKIICNTQQLDYFIKKYDLNYKDIGLMGLARGHIKLVTFIRSPRAIQKGYMYEDISIKLLEKHR